MGRAARRARTASFNRGRWHDDDQPEPSSGESPRLLLSDVACSFVGIPHCGISASSPPRSRRAMILWTIQHIGAWEAAERAGVLRASAQHAQANDRETADIFSPAYQWLIEEMRQRVGEPPPGVAYPVWAWAQCGSRGLKPNLAEPGHLAPNARGVCIEFEMPPERVLLSDFDLWHFVFGQDTHIPVSVEEMELLDEWDVSDRDVYTQAEIRASWNRIFDLDFSAPDIARPRAQKWIQGTVWEVPFNLVRAVEAFVAV